MIDLGTWHSSSGESGAGGHRRAEVRGPPERLRGPPPLKESQYTPRTPLEVSDDEKVDGSAASDHGHGHCVWRPARRGGMERRLYGGAAWIESSNLGVRGQDSRGESINLTIFDLNTNTGFTVGFRGGYWLDPLPFLGFDLDVFYLQTPVPAQTTTGTATLTGQFLNKPISVDASGVASIPNATLPLFGFAPEIRLRWPLMVDATFPHGRLQPYINAGPAWAFSLNNEHLAVEFGGKVGGGLAFQIAPWVALFGEYRYIFFPGSSSPTNTSRTRRTSTATPWSWGSP